MAHWRRVHEAQGLGASIAALRRARGLTQEELSEWLGVDRSTVVRLEAGDVAQLRRLMDALSVLGADLLVVKRTAHVTVTDEFGADATAHESMGDDLTGDGAHQAPAGHPRGEKNR